MIQASGVPGKWLWAVVAATLIAWCSAASADVSLTSFTPGDLVVLRGGDATYSQDTSKAGNYAYGEVPVFLDEYTTSGAYVGTIAVDSSGGPNTLTLPGKFALQHEGALNLSPNGQWLAFAGYNEAPSTTVPGNADYTIGKRVGVISATASSLDTSTVVNAYHNANPFIRAAFTLDGNEFWVAGKYDQGNSPLLPGGLVYVSGRGASATTTPMESYADWRNVIVANGQLYGGTGSSAIGTHGAYQIGTGLPTSSSNPSGKGDPSNQLLTAGSLSASNLAFVDISGTAAAGSALTMNGFNELYTVGNTSGNPNITKYFYNGTQWVFAGGVTTTYVPISSPTGLIAVTDPNNSAWVDLYVSGPEGAVSYIDTSGDPNVALPASGFSKMFITPTADEAFYGIAFVPAVPAPLSTSLVSTGVWGDSNVWSAGAPSAGVQALANGGLQVTLGGGTAICSELVLGSKPGDSGMMRMTGGRLEANWVTVGGSGAGTFVQSGGTSVLHYGLLIARDANSTGSFTLQDGNLVAPRITIGKGGTLTLGGGSLLGDELDANLLADVTSDGVIEITSGTFRFARIDCADANILGGRVQVDAGATLWVGEFTQESMIVSGTLILDSALLAQEAPAAALAAAGPDLMGPVPEPATAALLAMGGLAIFRRRRGADRRSRFTTSPVA